MTKQCEHKFGTAKIKCFFGHDVELKTIIDNAIKKHDIILKAELEEASKRDEFMDVKIDGFSYDEIWKKRGM